jgi:hypothetical protein
VTQMTICGLEGRVSAALMAAQQSVDGLQEIGPALLEVAKAVETLSQELKDMREELQDQVE